MTYSLTIDCCQMMTISELMHAKSCGKTFFEKTFSTKNGKDVIITNVNLDHLRRKFNSQICKKILF